MAKAIRHTGKVFIQVTARHIPVLCERHQTLILALPPTYFAYCICCIEFKDVTLSALKRYAPRVPLENGLRPVHYRWASVLPGRRR